MDFSSSFFERETIIMTKPHKKAHEIAIPSEIANIIKLTSAKPRTNKNV